jgi:hypothetical protein
MNFPERFSKDLPGLRIETSSRDPKTLQPEVRSKAERFGPTTLPPQRDSKVAHFRPERM